MTTRNWKTTNELINIANQIKKTMDQSLVIVKSRQINAPATRVWEILTETSTDWNGVRIETKSEWIPNSDIIFSFTWDGKEYADKGKIIRFDKQ